VGSHGLLFPSSSSFFFLSVTYKALVGHIAIRRVKRRDYGSVIFSLNIDDLRKTPSLNVPT